MGTTQDSWYALPGADTDVVLSTRVRMARNLANFPFPHKLRPTDGERIQSIVFDAFTHLPDGEQFQSISVGKLDALGTKILEERGVLPLRAASLASESGVILRTDGRIACSVNITDHLRMRVFSAGMEFEDTLNITSGIDRGLQERIQFAASYDFGYLTSSLTDAGSGLKLSLRLHLPSLAMLSKIRSLYDVLKEKGVALSSSFGSGGTELVSANGSSGTSLGAYYDVTLTDCQSGTELDQTACISSVGAHIRDMERDAREECKQTMTSRIYNAIYRSVALVRSSLFITLREAIAIISNIKWGLDLGILTGTSDESLHALLYRIQEGHLEYVLKNGAFHFENDIRSDLIKQNERLRALILQEAFQSIKLV